MRPPATHGNGALDFIRFLYPNYRYSISISTNPGTELLYHSVCFHASIKVVKMPKFSSFILIVSLTILLTSCHDNNIKDIRNYYFPLKLLTEGLVYEYQPVSNDSLTPAYWYYRSFIGQDGIFLTATYYEQDLVPLQLVREELVQNGMLAQNVYLYSRPDSTGLQQRTEVNVLENSAFPFEVQDSGGVFLYKAQWVPDSDPEAVITLIKNRRYVGDTVLTYNDKRHKGVIFEVKELVEYDKEGIFEQEYAGKEVYAKGIGLVYYDKVISDEVTWAYRLHKQYPMEELEGQFEQLKGIE
jgi:hypothetical protein